MKRKMISPVRQRAGLGENVFFNNAAESKHKHIKDQKRQNVKLAWTETVDLIKAICEEEKRNIERAMIGEGPFCIRPQFAPRLAVPFHTYIQKSHVEKNKVNQKIHSLILEDFSVIRKKRKRENKVKGKNLTECAYINISKSVGRKPGEGERPRDRSGVVVQRSTQGYKERLSKSETARLDTTTFLVKWLKGTKVYRCYRCRKGIRPKPT